MTHYFLCSWTLLKREVVRFLRQRHRIIGALGTPLLFWGLIGSGLGASFQSPQMGRADGLDYLRYFFPGTVTLIVLFTAIFSTISVIEDRREGFLQGVLVSPAPRSSIVLGKLLGGTVLAAGQGFLVLAIIPFLGRSVGLGPLLYALTLITILSFGLTGLGFVIAWRMESTQGFHAIMNLFLMPLWFLSGALFPIDGTPGWLRILMMLNPLSYSLAGLQQSLFNVTSASNQWLGSADACMAITILFSLAMFILSSILGSRRPKAA